MKSKSQPHSGLEVIKDHNTFAKVDGHLIREVDLKCIGCGTVWEHVAPLVSKPTVFCDECHDLCQECDHQAQKFWDNLLQQKHAAWLVGREFSMPHYRFGHNSGVYALRDMLFAHVRGAAALSNWDQRRLTSLGFTVPPFGERKL